MRLSSVFATPWPRHVEELRERPPENILRLITREWNRIKSGQ